MRAYTACEMAGILTSMENLMTFPWLRERVERGELDIRGWYFNLRSGDLLGYSSAKGAFVPLVPGSE